MPVLRPSSPVEGARSRAIYRSTETRDYAGEDSDISIALYVTNYRSLLKTYWYNIAYTYTQHADGYKLLLEY